MFIAPGVPSRPRDDGRQTIPLQEAAQTVFGVDGTAQLVTGPSRARQRWHVTGMVTTAGQPGDFVRLTLYRNFVAATSIIDSTFQGAQATSETDFSLLEGERLVAVWSGGTPASPAILVVSGDILL